ncbi:MAG: MFS transporter [Candidatus Dadabacteria bacterium]|nr:MFS transporter [Candidatus Dadabacteria bacterium]
MSDETMDASISKPALFSWYKEINTDQWKAFIAAFLGWTLDAMDLLLFAFAVSSIATVFNLNPSQVGAIFSVTLFSSAFGGALFGIVSDYVGRVRALTYTVLLYSAFTGISAFSPNVTFLLVCRLFLGLGMGGEWASGEVLVAESWPRQHRGKVIGMVQSGWAIGYILAAILATLIIPNLDINLGWRILFLIGITPAFLVFYIRRNLVEPEIWKKTAEMRKERKLSEKGQSFTLSQIFGRDLIRYTITATVLTSLCMIAYWGLYFWIPQFLSRPVEEGGVGLGTKGFAWIIPINIGAFIGCNTFGWISDRFGRRPVFFAYLVIMAILVWFFGHAKDLTTVLILGPFIGFFGTGFYSGFGAIFSEIFPTRARGTAQGFCYNFGRGVSAVAPPLVGYVAGIYGYGLSLITVSVFAVAAAIVVLTLPETKGKKLEIE